MEKDGLEALEYYIQKTINRPDISCAGSFGGYMRTLFKAGLYQTKKIRQEMEAQENEVAKNNEQAQYRIMPDKDIELLASTGNVYALDELNRRKNRRLSLWFQINIAAAGNKHAQAEIVRRKQLGA